MAHFAKIGLNGKVIDVLTVNNDVITDKNGIEQEQLGIDFLNTITYWPIWVQTSYNTYGNKHNAGGTPLRGNYAGIGYQYDQTNNVFYDPNSPYPSWILDKTTWLWTSPVPYPTDGNKYNWDETSKTWVLIST
jgi:hypothetical protein